MARSKNIDEIPMARRVSTAGGLLPYRLTTFTFLLIGFGILSFLIFSNLFSFFKFPSNRLLKAENTTPDQLLGHYRYPEASKEFLADVYPGVKVHRDVKQAFGKMQQEAANQGISLILLSGYRSIDLQRQIFYENKSLRNQIAIERAKVSAPPGYSEHSTGYAIDIGDGDRRETDFEVEFENTLAFKWMNKNAPRFHFILSFPRNNKQGVSYEPWHWRFEGSVEALRQFEPANQIRRTRK